MCGIVAVVGNGEPGILQEMMSRIRHRGPDGEGVFSMGQVSLGHRRLAIVDVAGGRQPMTNEAGDLAVVCNGEIYNHLALRRSLSSGHWFSSNSDTEILVHLFEEKGIDMLPGLDGMFALALANPAGLLVARDPLGIKPLYTAKLGRIHLVASELKAFPGGSRDIRALPAGHAQWIGTAPYPFRLPFEAVPPMDDISSEAAVQKVRARLSAAVAKRLMSDVPVGVFLSGGLDSSVIAALMRRELRTLHSFAAGFSGAPDLRAARIVAEHLGTIHHEVVYTPAEVESALSDIVTALESFDAPLVRSAIPGYFVARLASRFVKVVLSGEGADELFAGYPYLKACGGGSALRSELRAITENLPDTNLQRTDRMTMVHGLEGRVPFLDVDLVRFVAGLPVALIEPRPGRPEKWLLREACRDLLPPAILDRPKMKFSEGAGSAELVAEGLAAKIPREEFERARDVGPGLRLRSREELLYYRLWRLGMGDHIPPSLVGRTRDRTAAAEG